MLDFVLLIFIAAYPLPPRRTFLIRTLSTSVTIGWADQLCNGGHKLVGFKIRYFETSEYCYNSVSEGECRHSENIDPNLRAYTITGLRRNMEYGFQVIAVDSYAAKSPPSAKVVTTTLPPGT